MNLRRKTLLLLALPLAILTVILAAIADGLIASGFARLGAESALETIAAATTATRGAVAVAIVAVGWSGTIVLIWGLGRLVAEPVRNASTQLQAIERGGAGQPTQLRPPSADEFGRFVQNVNGILGELRTARAAAESATTARTELLGSIGQELRAPISGIIGAVDVLLRSRLDDRQRRYATMVSHSCRTLLGLVDDFVDFTDVESRRIAINPVEFDLRDVLDDSGLLMREAATQKGLSFDWGVHPSLAGRLKGDPLRIRQVLTRLIDNAIKFTESGGIAVRVMLDDFNTERVIARITVTDTGPGMPEQAQEEVFRPRSSDDPVRARRAGSSGLGLAICKRIVELMGGEIGVAAEVDRGSTFWFTLPLARLDAAPASAGRPTTDLRSLHILLMQEPGPARDELNGILTESEFRFEVSDSAVEGAALMVEAAAIEQGYDVVIATPPEDPAEAVGCLLETLATYPALAGTRLVLVGDRARLEPLLGDQGPPTIYLEPPVQQMQLLDAMVSGFVAARAPSINERAPAPAAPDQPTLDGIRVLVADDNDVSQAIAREVLADAGALVEAVDDGQSALEAIAARAFDAVLLDFEMPRVSGPEAARAIRTAQGDGTLPIPRSNRIPIIALTGSSSEAVRRACLDAGMDAVMRKPIESSRLVTVLARLVASSRQSGVAPEAGITAEAPQPGSAATDAADLPIDVPTLRLRCAGAEELVQELLGMFSESLDDALAAIRDALESRDLDTASRAARTLKGAALNVIALPVGRAAGTLEEAARAGDAAAAMAACDDLIRELDRFRRCRDGG